MLVFTDPVRTPDPLALALTLPRGTGLVYRTFGAPEALVVARQLAQISKQRGLILLIGADAGLASEVGAQGLHLPERLAHRAPRLRRMGWIITAAAHSGRASRVRGVDAVVVSTVFPSASPSAGKPMGPIVLSNLVRRTRNPVYALGGINNATASRLRRTGIRGLAAVDGIRT